MNQLFEITSGRIATTEHASNEKAILSIKEAINDPVIIAEFAKYGVQLGSLAIAPLVADNAYQAAPNQTIFHKTEDLRLEHAHGTQLTLKTNTTSKLINIYTEHTDEDNLRLVIKPYGHDELLSTLVDIENYRPPSTIIDNIANTFTADFSNCTVKVTTNPTSISFQIIESYGKDNEKVIAEKLHFLVELLK